MLRTPRNPERSRTEGGSTEGDTRAREAEINAGRRPCPRGRCTKGGGGAHHRPSPPASQAPHARVSQGRATKGAAQERPVERRGRAIARWPAFGRAHRKGPTVCVCSMVRVAG